ncbi:phage baseplate assembly protein V [Salinarimonas sp.]|uniref:phage baseplate assembly protein n=1 Tax=Salinarimonas sp. TaxID=2766526 RepID=UPI00391A9AED
MRDVDPARRSLLAIARGVFRRATQGKMQRVQADLLARETRDMEYAEPYGLTSVPHDGAEVIAVAPGGNRSHLVAICVSDRRYRVQGLESGDVALYNDKGMVVTLGRETLTIEAPAGMEIVQRVGGVSATLSESGFAIQGGTVTHDGVNIGATHVHGGVQPGDANTDVPVG